MMPAGTSWEDGMRWVAVVGDEQSLFQHPSVPLLMQESRCLWAVLQGQLGTALL